MAGKIRRHNLSDIVLHWFNALCWVLLLMTGLGLISNRGIDPIGPWWPQLIRSLFNGGDNLLLFHEVVGLIWIAGFLLYLAINFHGVVTFLKEVFTISLRRDLIWLIKQPLRLTIGEKGIQRLGINPEVPPQGFYNMGQKAFAQPALILGTAIAITGVIMFLSDKVLSQEHTVLVLWSITIHYASVGLVSAGLVVHVFMAAINIEERPAFYSMWSGFIPVEHVRHHNRLWYEDMVRNQSLIKDLDSFSH